MNNELMTFMIIMSGLKIDFDDVEPSFISIDKFLELYRNKTNDVINMSDSTFGNFVLVELLELYVLQRCDSVENTYKLLDELRNYVPVNVLDFEDDEDILDSDIFGIFSHLLIIFCLLNFLKKMLLIGI